MSSEKVLPWRRQLSRRRIYGAERTNLSSVFFHFLVCVLYPIEASHFFFFLPLQRFFFKTSRFIFCCFFVLFFFGGVFLKTINMQDISTYIFITPKLHVYKRLTQCHWRKVTSDSPPYSDQVSWKRRECLLKWERRIYLVRFTGADALNVLCIIRYRQGKKSKSVFDFLTCSKKT